MAAAGFSRSRLALIPIALATLLAGTAAAQESRPESVASVTSPRERAIFAGLDWLKRHQSEDGRWSCDSFSKHCDATRGAPCGGPGEPSFDVGVTSLAILAYLGAGCDTPRPGRYFDTFRRALKWLRTAQDAEGCFGPRADNRFTYSHAIATLAMSEAFASSRQLPWRKSAEAAVRFITAIQNPYKGWRYGVRPGDNDSSVTGSMLLALASARAAGIPVSEASIRAGLDFIDSVTEPETGRTGYMKKGQGPIRNEGLQEKFPASGTEALTAIAISARFACGDPDSPLDAAGAKLLEQKPPVWNEARGSIDMDYWYFGSRAMFQLGGASWPRWDQAFLDLAVAHQNRTGCAEGSWDPKDPWGREGGRVYATAIMLLALEVPYSFPARFPGRILARWTSEERRQNPSGFVWFATMTLERQLEELRKARTALANEPREFTAWKSQASEQMASNDVTLARLKAAFEEATTGGKGWPIHAGGGILEEVDLVGRVETLLDEKDELAFTVRAYDHWTRRVEEKIRELDGAIEQSETESKALRALEDTPPPPPAESKVEAVLARIHALLSRNEERRGPPLMPGDAGVEASTASRKSASRARDFLASKPESRK